MGFAADEGEAQEVEGLRFAEPAPLAAFRRKASELDDPGLLRMKRQRKLDCLSVFAPASGPENGIVAVQELLLQFTADLENTAGPDCRLGQSLGNTLEKLVAIANR